LCIQILDWLRRAKGCFGYRLAMTTGSTSLRIARYER
jgi:hypothetical protein